MTRRLRHIVFVCAVALTVSPTLRASSVLLRTASKAPPELLSVQTYAGKSEPLITAVQPSPPLTVVILLDTLSPAQFSAIEKDLLVMYAALRKHPLRIALLQNGSLGMAGPFPTRARLKAAWLPGSSTDTTGSRDLPQGCIRRCQFYGTESSPESSSASVQEDEGVFPDCAAD